MRFQDLPEKIYEPHSGYYIGNVGETIALDFFKNSQDIRHSFVYENHLPRRISSADLIWRDIVIEVKTRLYYKPSFKWITTGKYDALFLVGISEADKKIYKFFVPGQFAGFSFHLSKIRPKRWNRFLVKKLSDVKQIIKREAINGK